MAKGNPYNQANAVSTAGSQTYSKKATKAGTINPYNQYGADNVKAALTEQRQRQQSDQAQFDKQQKQLQQQVQQPAPAPSPAVTSAPKPNLLHQITSKVANFGANNIVKPIVSTGKAVGNTGSLAAAEATGNNQAIKNSKTALGTSYKESVPGAITAPFEDVAKEANKNLVQPIVKGIKHPELTSNKGDLMKLQQQAQQSLASGKFAKDTLDLIHKSRLGPTGSHLLMQELR